MFIYASNRNIFQNIILYYIIFKNIIQSCLTTFNENGKLPLNKYFTTENSPLNSNMRGHEW